MLNNKIHLNIDLFNSSKMIASRDGFGEGLVLAGEKDERVVALSADVTESVRMHLFKNRFPKRFIDVGIAEQNMAAVASGLAATGKIPVMGTYAIFSPGRDWEQIRTTISYNKQKVIIIGSHSGLNVGPDGGSHQALEDIALTRVLPNLAVIMPADAIEARKAILAAINYPTAVYIRLTRTKSPVLTSEKTPYSIGKSTLLWVPKDNKNVIVIFACGYLVFQALLAAKELEEEGVNIAVIDNSAIKPLDEKLIMEWAKKAKAIITLEEHQKAGGMGSAISEFLSEHYPLPITFMGVNDRFGQSGQADELIKEYGLDKDNIKKTVKNILTKTK